jgi:uridine phosphorylase
VSTGIGCPSTAIVVEELITLGVHTFLRIGTCGSLKDEIKGGDAIIATAAIRDEGTTRQYAPIEVPAIADFEMIATLQSAAIKLGKPHHVGLVHCKDSFYSELSEFTTNPLHTASQWETWRRVGALATEMEVAVIYLLSHLRRCRAGALLSVVGSTNTGDLIQPQTENHMDSLIDVGIKAMANIIQKDKEG